MRLLRDTYEDLETCYDYPRVSPDTVLRGERQVEERQDELQ